MNEEMVKVKKNGKLIAFSEGWQYWLLDGVIYSIRSDGSSICFWCSVERLGAHLHRLFQVTKKKFFTENEDMTVIDRTFLSQLSYA